MNIEPLFGEKSENFVGVFLFLRLGRDSVSVCSAASSASMRAVCWGGLKLTVLESMTAPVLAT